MEDLRNHLCGLGDRHSGPVEEEIAVRKRDVAVAHRLQLRPPRVSLKYGLFLQTSLQVESAGRHDQVLGIRGSELFSGDGSGILALFSKQEFAVRNFHQFGPPVSHCEWRVRPFQHDHGWPTEALSLFPDFVQALAFATDKGFATLLETKFLRDPQKLPGRSPSKTMRTVPLAARQTRTHHCAVPRWE